MQRTIFLYEESPGHWPVECPSIGAYSEGTSYDNALEMIKEAIQLHYATGGTADMEYDAVIMLVQIDVPDEWAKPAGYLGWARAFEIFHEYGAVDDVSAEHDIVYAGPDPAEVSPEHMAMLELLGWHPDEDLTCFYCHT